VLKRLGGRRALWLVGAGLLVAGFVKFTSELLEGELDAGDRVLIQTLASWRSPAWTAIAFDISALGSSTLLTLFALVAVVACWTIQDRRAALQIGIAAVTAPLVSILIKSHVERARPTEVTRLIDAAGFSYPSGHSVAAAYFYLTLAVVVSTRTRIVAARVAVLVLAIVLVILVALSRAYLGVHYPSDTLAGVTVGAGLALLLAAAFSSSAPRSTHGAS
jgi:undecaprenyl-diphosphatase